MTPLEEKDDGVWKPRPRKQPSEDGGRSGTLWHTKVTSTDWQMEGKTIIIERNMKVSLICPVLVAALSEL